MEELESRPLEDFLCLIVFVVFIAMLMIYAGIANAITPGSEDLGHLLMSCGAVSLILLAFSACIYD